MSSNLETSQPAGVLILSPGSAGHALSIRQKLFCQQYVKTRNGTKSARLAGYNGSDTILAPIASDMLRLPKIQAYIDELFRELHIGHDETLAELGQIARAEITKRGLFRPQDKLRALELAGKHHRLWDQPDEQSIDTQALAGELAQLIVQAVDRIKANGNTPESFPQVAELASNQQVTELSTGISTGLSTAPQTDMERRLIEYQAIVVQPDDVRVTSETVKHESEHNVIISDPR